GPRTETERNMSISRRTAIKTVIATTVGSATAGLTYGAAFERHRIGMTSTALPVAGLPPALDGLRISLITDIHHSRIVPAGDVVQAIKLAMSARPDLIVLGGDYVTFGDRAFVGPVAELLGSLQAPHGVFAVLGNHDDDRDMAAALAAKQFTVLKDQRTQVTIRNETLTLAGIRFWTRRAENIARVVNGAEGTVLLLAHDPRRLVEAANLKLPAVLSGHTHGGQIILPGVGAIARRSFPVLSGLGQQGDTSIFVSRGVGTIYVPVRINCPPEVALLTLRRPAHA
ncbi:MAG TPA: metallophosphoesterase, partial [Vicinamibacterales bacterium]|nr:metallophosphoesterase [Vicinamibacterales bacterium]